MVDAQLKESFVVPDLFKMTQKGDIIIGFNISIILPSVNEMLSQF